MLDCPIGSLGGGPRGGLLRIPPALLPAWFNPSPPGFTAGTCLAALFFGRSGGVEVLLPSRSGGWSGTAGSLVAGFFG